MEPFLCVYDLFKAFSIEDFLLNHLFALGRAGLAALQPGPRGAARPAARLGAATGGSRLRDPDDRLRRRVAVAFRPAGGRFGAISERFGPFSEVRRTLLKDRSLPWGFEIEQRPVVELLKLEGSREKTAEAPFQRILRAF